MTGSMGCSGFADPFCSGGGSSTMADFFVVPVGMQWKLGDDEKQMIEYKLTAAVYEGAGWYYTCEVISVHSLEQ